MLQVSYSPTLVGEPSSLSSFCVEQPFDILCFRSLVGLALSRAFSCQKRLKITGPQGQWAGVTTLLRGGYSVQEICSSSKMSGCGLTGVSLLDQAADSDDDNDPIQFMGQTECNLTSHPEGQDHELNGADGVDITMYGELNLIAEPQKVRTYDVPSCVPLTEQICSRASQRERKCSFPCAGSPRFC